MTVNVHSGSGAPTDRRTLVVVAPAHNEEKNVPYFYERACTALERIADLSWAIVFVNNASDDGSLAAMLRLRASDPRVKIVTLSRNFGYHPALLAGLGVVEADYYVILDTDCEDPPELLPDMLAALRNGHELAYGVRSRRDEPWLLTAGRRLFYQLNRRIADSEIVLWMGEFTMMTRQVRDAVLVPSTTYPFLRSELGYVGFHRIGLSYERSKRRFGRSHYNLWRLTTFAIGGLLSSSTFPLRLVTYVAVLLAVIVPIVAFGLGLGIERSASVAVIAGFYFLLFALPVLALYLARTYKNGVGRPVFVIDRARTYL